MNQQLLAYISDQLQAGLSYNDIETALLGVGWDEAEVKQALASFANQQSQSSVNAQPEVQSASPEASPLASEPMPVQQPTTAQAEPTVDLPDQATANVPDTSALASVVGEAAVSGTTLTSGTISGGSSPRQTAGSNVDAQVQLPAEQQASNPSQTLAEPAAVADYSAPPPTAVVGQPAQPSQSAVPTERPTVVTAPVNQQTAQPASPYGQASGISPSAAPVVPAMSSNAMAQLSPQPIVQQPYQSPQMQPYQVNGYGSQPAASYVQAPKSNTGGIGGLLNKKMIIVIAAGIGFLVLVLIIALVLTGGKKSTSNTNNNSSSSQNSSGGLVESQAFISERGGFSINPPKGWHAQELTSTNDVTVAISKETTDKSQFSSMTVTVSTIQDAQAATTNLDNFVNFYKTATAQSNPQTKVNDDQKISLDGVDARLLDVDTVNDSTKVTGYMVYIIKDKKLYQIQAFTYDVTPNSEVKKAMRQSIESLKFSTSGSPTPSTSPGAMPTPKS